MKKTKGNSERGITLVALIITIIVMLILVAVTVTVLVDSDIIGKSETAGALYRNAYAKEGEKVSDETIEGEGLRHSNIEGYLQDICKHNNIEDGKCTECGINKQDICDHNFVDGECTECGKENLINFKILGKQYVAKEGMSFGEWVSSEYCTDNFEFDNELYSSAMAFVDGLHYTYIKDPDGDPYPVVLADTPVSSCEFGVFDECTYTMLSFSVDGINCSIRAKTEGSSWVDYYFSSAFNLEFEWDGSQFVSPEGKILYKENSDAPVFMTDSICEGDQFIFIAP